MSRNVYIEHEQPTSRLGGKSHVQTHRKLLRWLTDRKAQLYLKWALMMSAIKIKVNALEQNKNMSYH